MIRQIISHVLLAALVLGLVNTALSAPTAKQRQQIQALQKEVFKAGNYYQRKKYKESGDMLRNVQKQVEILSASGDQGVLNLLKPIHQRLTKAHSMLKSKGVTLPPLLKLGAKPKSAARPVANTGPTLPLAGEKVSFVKHVATILISKCGRCHVNRGVGDFSMSSFETLMKGTPDGAVIIAGDAGGSRLIEVIKEGEMPRGGIKITPQEIAALVRWVAEGAKYDGDSQQTALIKLAPNVRAAQAPRVAVTKATGNETISFSRDLAPLISEKCANCHGRARMPSGRFNLNTFSALLRGGQSGPPVLPGNPAESLIIKKLKGTAGGNRMPLRQDPLPSKVIAKFEKWISEGAKFDGPSATQLVEQVASLGKAKSFDHNQLAADRAKRTADNWKLGMPGIDADRGETKNFLLMGNVGQEKLNQYGQQAEAIVPKIAEIFGASTSQPLVKGRMTIYFFKIRYDYSEFGQMVEKRQLPRFWQGHWRFNIIEAYAAIVSPRNEVGLDALIAQQVSGTYVASLASLPPQWFSEGSARAVAATIDPEDSRVAEWDRQLPEVLAAMQSPNDFATGKLSPESSYIVSYSFIKLLMSDADRYRRLIDQLRAGKDFAQSFGQIYGGSVAQITERWMKSQKK